MTKQQTDFMKELLGGLNNEITRQAQRIAELEQEIAGMKHVAEAWKDKFMKHSKTLSRYAGAVEVEGDFWANGLFNCTISIRDDFGKLEDIPAGQRVKVLVMKEVE